MKKERNIKNGTTSKEELDSARRLWLSIICNTGEKKKKTNMNSFTHTKKKRQTKEMLGILYYITQTRSYSRGRERSSNYYHLGRFHPNEFSIFQETQGTCLNL